MGGRLGDELMAQMPPSIAQPPGTPRGKTGSVEKHGCWEGQSSLGAPSEAVGALLPPFPSIQPQGEGEGGSPAACLGG